MPYLLSSKAWKELKWWEINAENLNGLPKDGGYKTTSSSDPRGRFGFRMGNNVERNGDERILDRNRKRNIDQHEGTTDDSIRSSAPRKKI